MNKHQSLSSTNEFPSTEFFVSSIIFNSKCTTGGSSTPVLNATPAFLPLLASAINNQPLPPCKTGPCSFCWRPAYKFVCVSCLEKTGKLTDRRNDLAHLFKVRQNLIDEITHLWSQYKTVPNNLSSRLDDQRHQCQVLGAKLALKAENCSSKRRHLRMIRAEFGRTQHSLQKLKTAQKFELTYGQGYPINAALEHAKGCLNFERKQLALDLFERVFCIERFLPHAIASTVHPAKKLNDLDVKDEGAEIDRDTLKVPEITVIDALVDAATTHYVDDRWVSKSQEAFALEVEPPTRFRLVGCCVVDDNSDYNSWVPWLFESTSYLSPTSDTVFENAKVTGGMGALSLAWQLVDCLARLFDETNLLCSFSKDAHNDLLKITDCDVFYRERVKADSRRFKIAVSALNWRVATLCALLQSKFTVSLSRPFNNLFELIDHLKMTFVDINMQLLQSSCLQTAYQEFKTSVDASAWRSFCRATAIRRSTKASCKKVTQPNHFADEKSKADDTDDEWETIGLRSSYYNGSLRGSLSSLTSRSSLEPPTFTNFPRSASDRRFSIDLVQRLSPFAVASNILSNATTTVTNLFKTGR